MASKSLVANVFVCTKCQRYLARSTIALSKPPPAPSAFRVQRPARRFFHPDVSRTIRQAENKDDHLWADDLDKSTTSAFHREEAPRETVAADVSLEEASSVDHPPEQDASIPWYLQEQAQQPDDNPFSERQRLPELPENPPPILQPLLKHASIDLGLDYLTILDLRSLDFPPALGSNLVMILGSARSEKHLNVSADRLCRWLRTNYKLAPIADGLIGRNELKLKLKRKNRRARLLSAAGASSPSDPDDGISTGWICVNVGNVEDGPNKSAKDIDVDEIIPKFVGFGGGTEGAKIVVQIMTESKRGDVDLEGLWKEALDDSLRRQQAVSNYLEHKIGQARTGGPQDGHEAESGSSDRQSSFSTRSIRRHSTPGFRPQHVRSFHTCARSQAADGTSNRIRDDHLVDHAVINQLASAERNPEPQADDVHETIVSDNSKEFNSNTDMEGLRQQLNYLQKQKPSLAIWLLGTDQEDLSSTSFLRSFHQNIPIIPEAGHLFARFELHCYAIKIGHQGYTRDRLLNLLCEMQASAVVIPEETFLVAFEVTLMAHSTLSPDYRPYYGGDRERLRSAEAPTEALRHILASAFEILERMESYGHDVRSKRVFMILHDAIANPVFEPPGTASTVSSMDAPEPAKLDVAQHARFRHMFRRALDSLYAPPPNDNALYTQVLRAYIAATPADWSSFWEFWHHLARAMRPRTAEMYALMFNGVANTDHEAKCQEILMYMFPEMEREIPIVECTGEVAGAVLECLIKAKVSRNVPPWQEMWEAAEKGL